MPALSNAIDWPGIRANSVTMGIRAAARAAAVNLPPDEQTRFVNRVLQRAHREGWVEAKQKAMSSAVVVNEKPLSSPVISGSDSIAAALAADSDATKVGFSTAARKFASKVATMAPSLDKDRAQAIRHMAGVASSVHGWEAKTDGGKVNMINIGILFE